MTDEARPGPEGPHTPTAIAVPVDMIAVESTNILSIGYAPEARYLFVAFRGGPLWCYAEVPPEKWEAFRSAPSVGGFFAREIRPAHPGMRVQMPEGATDPDADERTDAP